MGAEQSTASAPAADVSTPREQLDVMGVAEPVAAAPVAEQAPVAETEENTSNEIQQQEEQPLCVEPEVEEEPLPSIRTQVRSLSDQISQLETQCGVLPVSSNGGAAAGKDVVNTAKTTGSGSDSGSGGSQRLGQKSARTMLDSFRSVLTMSTNREKKHKDDKMVVEGIAGLSLCAALNQVPQLKLMLAHYEPGHRDPNRKDYDDDRYPLHWAAARGHMRCIKLLLDAGADVEVVDANGNTPADLALLTGAQEAHDLLVYGSPLPDPKPMSSDMSRDALSLHCALSQRKELSQVLDKGTGMYANPNRRDKDGDRVPLHWAAARGAKECVRLLIAAGAQIDAVDNEGRTPADLALLCNQRSTHTLLSSLMAEEQETKELRYLTPKASPSTSPLKSINHGADGFVVESMGGSVFGKDFNKENAALQNKSEGSEDSSGSDRPALATGEVLTQVV